MRRHLIIQEQIRQASTQSIPIALSYGKGHSNTTRSKKYKKGCLTIPCGELNHILEINQEKKSALVEPRVTMHQLVQATLPYGLMPAVVPEFKGITVGGAILGAAAESSSHRYGIFHDSCTKLELIDGKGELLHTSPSENPDLFYGLSGSYGSLGLLTAAEIRLVRAPQAVRLHIHNFSDPHAALEKMILLIGQCDFLDGVIFAPNHAVIIEAEYITQNSIRDSSSVWYVNKLKSGKMPPAMPLYDYLFRYDPGAFWMGTFLFSPSFLARYIGQGLLKLWPSQGWFTQKEIAYYRTLRFPNAIGCACASPFMSSQRLWGLLHKAEKWVQDRFVIQDCCIPVPHAGSFLDAILQDPGVLPIWLCPIKGTTTNQYFAPHFGYPTFMNFGLYGVASYSAPMEQIIQQLEQCTHAHHGRKVLYSRSYYTEQQFWQVYPQEQYLFLRKKTHAENIWRGLLDKVLSE